MKAVLLACEEEARLNHWAVCVAVVDSGGHLLGLQRLDGASPATASIAFAKAHSSAVMRRDSKQLEDMINGGRTAFLSAPVSGLLEGGVPIMSDGACIGAVGVSGVKSAEDAQIARAGIAALGVLS